MKHLALAFVLIFAPMAAPAADYFPRMWNCKPIASEKTAGDRAKVSATSQLIARLKDPESARLGPARYVRAVCDEAAYDIVCGSVNARNSFGGYTGAGSWVYIASKERRWIFSEENQEIGALQAMIDGLKLCAKAP